MSKRPEVGERVVHTLEHIDQERHGTVEYHVWRDKWAYQPDDHGGYTVLVGPDETWRYE
jgi:hypothetical protein